MVFSKSLALIGEPSLYLSPGPELQLVGLAAVGDLGERIGERRDDLGARAALHVLERVEGHVDELLSLVGLERQVLSRVVLVRQHRADPDRSALLAAAAAAAAAASAQAAITVIARTARQSAANPVPIFLTKLPPIGMQSLSRRAGIYSFRVEDGMSSNPGYLRQKLDQSFP